MERRGTLADWAGFCHECRMPIRTELRDGGWTTFYEEDGKKYCAQCAGIETRKEVFERYKRGDYGSTK